MADIEKVLKDVVLCGVGAAASAVEKGSEIARTFVEKGQKTVDDNREAIDSFKGKVKTACDSFQTLLVNLEQLSREQLEQLKQKIEELERKQDEAAHNDDSSEPENANDEIPTIVVKDDGEEK